MSTELSLDTFAQVVSQRYLLLKKATVLVKFSEQYVLVTLMTYSQLLCDFATIDHYSIPLMYGPVENIHQGSPTVNFVI